MTAAIIQFLLGVCTLYGTYALPARLLQFRQRHYEAKVTKAQKQSLESTIEWAYLRGAREAFESLHGPGGYDARESAMLAVTDFRLTWGEDLREVAE